jgi:hypothetical protein
MCYCKRCPGQAPPSLAFQGTVIRSGGAMNRGATLMHYDFRVVTYTPGGKPPAQFTIRAYLKNGKRWAKFPSLAAQTRMLVVGKICGVTTRDRDLAILVDGFTFLSGNNNHSSSQLTSPKTPLSTKRSLKDLWDRTDLCDDDIGPSTPSKVRRFTAEEEFESPSSSRVEVWQSPLPIDDSQTPPATSMATEISGPDTREGDDEGTVSQGKRPQRGRKALI